MISRPGAVVRVCSILLLALMVSPITAPFSTCDLRNLLGDSGASGAAVLQSKPLTDDAVAGPATSVRLPLPAPASTALADAAVSLSGWRLVRHTPLRI